MLLLKNSLDFNRWPLISLTEILVWLQIHLRGACAGVHQEPDRGGATPHRQEPQAGQVAREGRCVDGGRGAALPPRAAARPAES